jgi:hypothetical protein
MIRTKLSAYGGTRAQFVMSAIKKALTLDTTEIVMGRNAIWRVYRAYWKTHPLIMALIAFSIRRRIETRKQVLIRVHPDEPNPLAGVTDPPV